MQNICCMDKYESKVYMFCQDTEFKVFELSGNMLVETYADEGDGTSYHFGDHS